LNDLVQLRFDRAPQGVVADIADANQDDLRSNWPLARKRCKIFILGDERSGGTSGVSPNVSVAGDS
jgi:hypothetical protein